jgi:hypothetical protein
MKGACVSDAALEPSNRRPTPLVDFLPRTYEAEERSRRMMEVSDETESTDFGTSFLAVREVS